jgi:hypothetical protein
MKNVLRFSAIGSKTMAPIRTLKNTMDEGDISSTATFRNRYGIPQRKPSNANLPQPDLVNYFPLPKIALISKAISE